MPAPEPRVERPVPSRGADVLVPAAPAFGEQPARPAGKAAVADVMPSRTWVVDEPLATTGRGQGVRTAAPRVPRVPRQTTPAGTPSSSYGDWTKPSRSDETGRSRLGPDAGPELQRVPLAPATTAIPERETAARRDQVADLDDDLRDDFAEDEYYADADADPDHDHDDDELPAGGSAVVAGPGIGSAKRSRATYRAERQAADAARRKAAKRNGTPDVLFEDELDRKPRRVLKGLVAMAVVAGAVLGVYTVTQPGPTAPVAQADAAAPSSPPPVAPPTQTLPPLNTLPLDVEAAATTPVRVPVTVLNATNVTGLAGSISDTVVAGGWESPGAGAYPGTDVATTTVFFTEGDEQQRQAALQLIEQFPDLAGPAPRFFEVADVPAPGLVIVATGNWQP
ncbi:LytR C-terminal domain-containing protein [Blastococcus capsensis]|uniref:LytR C-terminal domain-containing protein n=1 Tax=Blastococcus capsensis TaxID=1564163 RepID=UPI002540C751|nr:LytR C-terminal domain-containing protein [Blastococcus capsensis]MDK3257248.1 LytR C-terminal domain-containing protein [Blastococcus capsensis]